MKLKATTTSQSTEPTAKLKNKKNWVDKDIEHRKQLNKMWDKIKRKQVSGD